MSEVSVHEAKARFSELLHQAEAGETVVITRHRKAIVELKPIHWSGPIRIGAFDGEFQIPPDAFVPMTESELKDWYGE